MSSKATILGDLDQMSDLVTSAREGLRRDELVDVSGINEQMQQVVESINDLPVEDLLDIRPALQNLLTEFQDFSKEVEQKIAEIGAAAEADTEAGGRGG